MVEIAIRNGTYVPQTHPPPARRARVDLSKKPQLWEVYLRGKGGGWQPGSLGHAGGGKREIDTEYYYSRDDWESIKPIYAGFYYSGSTPTSLVSPPVSIPAPINPSAPRRDEEENRPTTEVSTGTTTPATPRSLFTRARIFLNPNSATSQSSADDHETNSRSNISMTELGSNLPPKIRVAVLIAMPSPPSSHEISSSSAKPLVSASPLSSKNKARPTTSHPLEYSPTLRDVEEEEQPVPHLEMGVAEVVVISRSDNGEEKIIHSRGSSCAEP
jgi:hypothetical protein